MLSDGDDAVFLASAYGLTADDWQADVLEGWMGRRRDGKWAAKTCGLAMPRQNGKNGVIEIRELFGMIELGEKFLHTAHQVKTAKKAFKRIASFFENERQYPELAALVKEIRKANGQEAIVLENGGSVEFIARSSTSGRGFTVDVLVFDEAQDLTDDELDALLPTISAAPLGNPQVIMTGTPPDPDKDENGEVFLRVRGDVKDTRQYWADYGVKDGPLPDVDDRQVWQDVNPALGTRLQLAEVERERRLQSIEGFARERLGWWGENPGATSVIDRKDWDAGLDETSQIVGRVVFGLEMPNDRVTCCIGAAGINEAGKKHVEVVEERRDTDWVVEWFTADPDREHTPVAVDARGQAASLIPELEQAGVTVLKLNGTEVAAACGSLFDDITQRRVAHIGQPELDAAVAGVVIRDHGDAFVWGRKHSTAHISPLYAVTLAARGLTIDPGPLDNVGAWNF